MKRYNAWGTNIGAVEVHGANRDEAYKVLCDWEWAQGCSNGNGAWPCPIEDMVEITDTPEIDPLLDRGTHGDYRGQDPFGVWKSVEDVQIKINALEKRVEGLKSIRDAADKFSVQLDRDVKLREILNEKEYN